MYRRIVLLFVFLSLSLCCILAQESDTTRVEVPIEEPPVEIPVISYASSPKKYKIADIQVSGVNKDQYQDFTIIGFSGLAVGDEITVPGDDITDAVKRFWRHGLFSHVSILANKIEDGQIWLEFQLKQRPRISGVTYHGVKKSEREDLESKVGLRQGFQITPNAMDRAKIVIQRYFDEKGFKNVEIDLIEKDDLTNEGYVFVDVMIDKKQKTKVHQIHFTGNEALSDLALKKAMKKTNEKFNLKRDFKSSFLEMFSTKKFTSEEYENDKNNIISKYNEFGYRDAALIADSVINYDEKTVEIYLSIDEGTKYYLKDLTFVGNTKYPTDYLQAILDIKPGEIYNQKRLDERLNTADDAVSNVYYNDGYLFFGVDPVEVEIDNDSISLEIRIQEGPQATINRVIINGNDRLYEDIVRRELYTKPGDLFSREELVRSVREIAQTGHFDPENMDPRPLPNYESGTVDIEYNLVSKANDQIELSAGYGQTGVIGRVSLRLTNFSMKNLLNPKSYKGIIPQGEGQTLSLSGQTNGRYYQSYSISFIDPWFGGKRPNTLSASLYYARQTGVSSSYLSNAMTYNPYMYSDLYGGSSYYGGRGNYGSGNYGGGSYYDYAYDPDKLFNVFGASIGYGKRLNWPDDYFQFMGTLNYQLYNMKNWDYFMINNGTSHNINVELTFSRSSTDNPLYTRYGSQFSFSVSATPPFSLWDGKDYASMNDNDPNKHKMIEYHKWKFKAKIFSPLTPSDIKRTPVLMSRIEYGFLGTYNKHKKSPFETFYVGGDGMTGYSGTYATETVGLRGYPNGSIAGNGGYSSYAYAYSRLALELRYPFLLETTSTIYGLAFVEAGNAWTDVSKFNPFNLKRSAGFGVRIILPMIGLMGVDWAYGFDQPNHITTGKSRGGSNWHFVIGQEF